MDNSNFSRLPAELRNNIYELALTQYDSIAISINGIGEWRPPAILHCCQQLRGEASPVYYARNTFTVSGIHRISQRHPDVALGDWLRLLSPPSRTWVRRVHLDDYFYSEREVGERIERCKKQLQMAGVGSERIQIFVLSLPDAWIEIDDYDCDPEWRTA